MARDRHLPVILGVRWRGVDAGLPEHAHASRPEKGEHTSRAHREADGGGDAMVLERLLQRADPIDVRLEEDDVLLDEDAREGLDRSLRVHECRQATLARLSPGDVVAQHPLQELLALGTRRLEHPPRGQVHEGRALARGCVFACDIPVGGDEHLAPALVEPGARRRVRVGEEAVR